MTNEQMAQKAFLLALEYNKNAVDKGGNDYILHPFTVALMVDDSKGKIVAWLHDIVEDTTMTLDKLLEEGFTNEIVDAVDAVTRRVGELRQDYLNRVKSNKLACMVKIADLNHNSDLTRIKKPKQRDYERVAQYKLEIEFLKNS